MPKFKTINVRPATHAKFMAIVRLRGLVTIANAMDVLVKEEAARLVLPTAKRINEEMKKLNAFARKSAAGGED